MSLPAGLQQSVSLDRLNTLGIAAQASYYLRAINIQTIVEGLRFAQAHKLDVLVLGGGSNLVLRGDFPGLVIHIALTGVVYEQVSASEWLVTAAAGESWHDLVEATVARGLRGIENLALIPGTVGAAPVQNIGAYGVELKDSLVWVDVLDSQTGTTQRLSAEECGFGYRQSLFKSRAGRHLIILSVCLRLDMQRPLHTDYADLAQALASAGQPLSVKAVMNAVVAVRLAKLPDPDVIPNAGSFFKNPLVDCRQFESLQQRFPNLVHYPLADGSYKLAAAWLIDQAGWKGYRNGGVGVHERQALVLVNPGRRTGAEVLELARTIRQSVFDRYGVELEIEPVVV